MHMFSFVRVWTAIYLHLVSMRLHNITTNLLQRLRGMLEIAHLIPNLRAAPHPNLPVVRVMRHVRVRPVEEAQSEGLVDFRCVLYTRRDRQGHIHLSLSRVVFRSV